MLLAACHGSCSVSCRASLPHCSEYKDRDYHRDPVNIKYSPSDWLTPVLWCGAIDASCYSILVLISGQKNTRKRPKHFAIYLDKTLLIPVRVAGSGKMSGWLMFMAGKKLGQGLSGHWSTGLHHQDKMIRDVPRYFPVFALNLSLIHLSQGNLVINLVWCLDIWLTPIMSCVRHFTPGLGHWEGVGSGAAASNFLSYYPNPQAGKWVKIYNFKFALLDLITVRVNQDNNGNAWH